jgi:hypothetical protein
VYLFFELPLESTVLSMSVFQAPQAGHLPNQRGVVPPQSEQVKMLLSLAMSQA